MIASRTAHWGAALLAASTWATTLSFGGLRSQDPATAARLMQGHFDAALEVHAAVIRGDLVGAGVRADSLARALDQEKPAPGSARAQAAVLDAARAVGRATDVLGAARATADMLNGCGRCHKAAHVTPPFAPKARIGGDTLAGQMHAHRQAVDLLLEGLIVPSDEAWRNGARELATAPLHDPMLPVDPAVHQSLAATEARFHRLATEAEQSADPRARAAFYAQFLAGCADCHRRHRPGPVEP